MKKSLFPLLLAISMLVVFASARAATTYEPYTFSTFAGIPPGSTNGVGSAARFNYPYGVAVDPAGNIYVADTYNHVIRKITPSRLVTTFAGSNGSPGSADGQCSTARFNKPQGVAADQAGNVYVADTYNQTIRKITPAGLVTTLAGVAGEYDELDGPAGEGRFYYPTGIAVDGAGNVYVSDSSLGTIRKILPSGDVSTLAGNAGEDPGYADGNGDVARFNYPTGLAVDAEGDVFVADTDNSTIRKITPDREVTTVAGSGPTSVGYSDGPVGEAQFSFPGGVAVDSAGNIFVFDSGNEVIRQISPAGSVTTTAGTPGVAGSADGNGGEARFDFALGMAIDTAGDLYLADTYNFTIRKVTPAGSVSTVAGMAGSFGYEDGPRTEARFRFPTGVAFDSAGNTYVADTANNTIRKIDNAGLVSTLAGSAVLTGGSDDGEGSAARFSGPRGLAVDGANNIYLADSYNHTVRKITANGVVSTLAGLAAIAGNEDGVGSEARFNDPRGVAVDSAGNVYVADHFNRTVRKISPAGEVTTLAGLAGMRGSTDGQGSAARFRGPRGVAVDGAGNVYVSDSENHTIRKITSAGEVSTLAGSPQIAGSDDGIGNAARFNFPRGVAVDKAGNVFVSDVNNNTIRKITSAGVVTTIAGLPGTSGSADGAGSTARFSNPEGVAVDGAGNVYIADSDNNTIRSSISLPVITSPLSAIAVTGQKFVYQFEAAHGKLLTVKNLPLGLTFEPSLSAIVGKPTTTGTFQVELAASNGKGTTSKNLTLVAQDTPPIGPMIVSGSGATGRTGEPFEFRVIAVGTTPGAQLAVDDCPCGLTADPITGVISGTPTSDGSSAVKVTVAEGNLAAASTVQLTFTSDLARPVILGPSATALTAGQTVTYQINAPSTLDAEEPTVFTVNGDLPPGLEFDPSSGRISGTFMPNNASRSRDHPSGAREIADSLVSNVQLFATNSSGTATTPLTFLLAPTGVVNISTRIPVNTGDSALIGGFIITGNAPKKVIVRAIGPSLPVAAALQDPTLELHQADGTLIVRNDNWATAQEQEILGTNVAPTDPRESAIVATLAPGNYTAVVAGKDGTAGVALVEVYDLGTASLDPSNNAKLANISTRGLVQNGDDVMIGGFIVSAESSKVIVRAIGPELSASGITGALADTVLELHDVNGSLVSSNDNWREGFQEEQIIATTVPPTDNRESAIVATLAPGGYTAVVRGKDGSTGIALVEVYALGAGD